MAARLAAAALLFLGAAPALPAFGPFGRLSFRLSPGVMFNLGGSYDDTSKFRDIVSLGGGLNLGLRYEVNKNFYLDAAYGYSVMPVKSGARPFSFRHRDSYFNLSSASLNAQLYLKSGYPMEPYLTIGGGVYPWVFRSGMFGGSAWPAPARPQASLRASSPGINIGFGVEANLLLRLTALFELRYTYLFSRDPKRFWTNDLTQVDFLGISLGVIYYFERR